MKFKGLPFKTVWLEYPQIEPTLRDLGVTPTLFKFEEEQKTIYTVPVIIDSFHLTPNGDPTVVSDSWAIAEYLDEIYPNPIMLFPQGTKALQSQFLEDFMKDVFSTLLPALVPTFPDFLNDESRP